MMTALFDTSGWCKGPSGIREVVCPFSLCTDLEPNTAIWFQWFGIRDVSHMSVVESPKAPWAYRFLVY